MAVTEWHPCVARCFVLTDSISTWLCPSAPIWQAHDERRRSSLSPHPRGSPHAETCRRSATHHSSVTTAATTTLLLWCHEAAATGCVVHTPAGHTSRYISLPDTRVHAGDGPAALCPPSSASHSALAPRCSIRTATLAAFALASHQALLQPGCTGRQPSRWAASMFGRGLAIRP